MRALHAYGIPTELTVLSRSEQEGKELLPESVQDRTTGYPGIDPNNLFLVEIIEVL